MAAGTQRIIVRLNLETGELEAGVNRASFSLNTLSTNIRNTSNALEGQREAARGVLRGLEGWILALGHIGHAIQNVKLLFGGIPAEIAKVNAEFERMEALLRGLSGSSEGMYGKSGGIEIIDQQAMDDMNYLINLAKNSPFALNQMTESFVKLKAAGLEPLTENFKTLIDASAKFGRTSEELKRASVAIQQMVGKGVISMEELRQQLGEAIPTAMRAMARGMRISMGELAKIVSSGTVESTQALQLMFEQMKLESEDASLIMADTFGGTLERMKTNLQLLAREVGNAGYFDVLKNEFQEFTDVLLTSDHVIDLARRLSGVLERYVIVVSKVVTYTIKWSDELLLLAKALAIYLIRAVAATAYLKALAIAQAAHTAATHLCSAALGILTMNYNAATVAANRFSWSAYSPTVAANMKRVTLAAFAMGGTLKGIATIMVMTTRAFLTMIGPIGQLALAIYALTKAWKKLKEHWTPEDPNLLLDNVAKQMKQGSVILKTDIQEMERMLEKEKAILTKLREHQSVPFAGNKARAAKLTKDLQKKIEVSQALVEKISSTLNDATKYNYRSAGLAEINDELRDVHNRMLAGRNEFIKYSEDMIEFQKQKHGEGEEARKAAHDAIIEAQGMLYDRQIEMLKEHVKEQERLLAEQNETPQSESKDPDIIRLKKKWNLLQEAITEVERQKGTLSEGMLTLQQLMSGGSSGNAGFDKDPTMRYWQQLKIKIEGARAKLHDLNVEAAKTEKRFAEGILAKGNDSELYDAIMKDANYYDTLTQKIKQKSEAIKLETKVTQRLLDVKTFMAAQDFKNRNDNPFLAAGQQAALFAGQLKGLIKQLEKLRGMDIEGWTFPEEKFQSMVTMMDNVSASAMVAGLKKMEDELFQYELSLASADEAAKMSFDRQREHVRKFVDEFSDNLNDDAMNTISEYLASLDHMERLATNSFEKLMLDWSNVSYDMQDIFTDLFEGMSQSLTDFILTGEMDMQQFLQNIMAMIIQSQIQKAIAEMFSYVTNVFGSGMATPSTSAMGNIVDSRGARPLKRYASGGVANSPQISLFGEGDMPEAYVPLPDGRSIPVTVSSDSTNTKGGNVNVAVNVINQTGEDVGAEQQGGAKFDGEKYIVDVLMKKLATPGPVRDAVRGTR